MPRESRLALLARLRPREAVRELEAATTLHDGDRAAIAAELGVSLPTLYRVLKKLRFDIDRFMVDQ